jgi:hypothetical protein
LKPLHVRRPPSPPWPPRCSRSRCVVSSTHLRPCSTHPRHSPLTPHCACFIVHFCADGSWQAVGVRGKDAGGASAGMLWGWRGEGASSICVKHRDFVHGSRRGLIAWWTL